MQFCTRHADKPILALGLCSSCYHKDWDQKNKEKRRAMPSRSFKARKNSLLKCVYGISLADFDSLAQRQAGLCALCQQPPKNGLVVDHNHTTGKVRGLLCDPCNVALGFYEKRLAENSKFAAYMQGGL